MISDITIPQIKEKLTKPVLITQQSKGKQSKRLFYEIIQDVNNWGTMFKITFTVVSTKITDSISFETLDVAIIYYNDIKI